jgi:guanylate kinase
LSESRSWTTRPRRPDEDPNAYTFVDEPTFRANARSGGFLEWAEYAGHLYGTPRPELASGKDVVVVIEVQGAAQVLERVPGARMILIVPPSRAVQRDRLEHRGDPPARVEERLALAETEERIGRELAHHVVVNDDVERAVDEVAGILDSYRRSPA